MTLECLQGVILQASYRVHHGIPVVYLFGRLTDGRTFLVRDNRERPHFYIESQYVDSVSSGHLSPSRKQSFAGEALTKIEVGVPQDAPAVRDALHAQGVSTYEADIRFAMRYLIDRGIKGGVEICGVSEAGRGTQLVFDNPQLTPAEVSVDVRVLSFDIETNANADKLLAIACYGEGVDEVVVVDPEGRDMPAQAVGVRNERSALVHFCELVQRFDPDVLTGWNVIDFDLSVLARIAKRVKVDLQLGREPGLMRIRPARGYFGSGHANIPGRVVLDGIDLLRGAFVKMDEYSLEAVAQNVLGEGKTLGGGDVDKVEQILHTYAEDLAAFTQYARTDARLALQILERLKLVKLAFVRSSLTGMPPDRVAASIASFDFLYISALHQRNIAAPSVKPSARTGVPQSGGAVFEPLVGIHENVWVCDFKSLYPSIIRTFNIDPLAFVQAELDDNAITTYNGTSFSRQDSILPNMLDNLFPQRERAKNQGDEIASQAIKILMNSFYGVLGTSACRFYNPAIANAITSQGRYLLGWSRTWFESRGYRVLYGDTDSVFVSSGVSDEKTALAQAKPLIEEFNRDLTTHITKTVGVESKLELEFEKLYTTLFLARVRGGSAGARKRYAGKRAGEQDIEFVGMEVVRRDWTELAKIIQRNLFERLFNGEEVADYLRDIVFKLRSGVLDDQLVYKRGLRKPVSAYTSNVPPHVQAVKKSQAAPPRIVHYVMTMNGAELINEMTAELDRELYLERQVMPVAEPVLEVLGLSFNQVIGDDRQIDLF